MNNFQVFVPLKNPVRMTDGRKITQVTFPTSGESLYTREQATNVLKTFYGRFPWEEGSELECWAESENERFTLHFPEMLLTLWITIDDGETFEGTIMDFRNCFFDNASKETIQQWCDDNKMRVVFTFRNPQPSQLLNKRGMR
jgi:hypothetical protein